MIDDPLLNPLFNPSSIASPLDVWPYYYTNTITPTANMLMAPKIEENNPEELKINVKKRQIKFNFVL